MRHLRILASLVVLLVPALLAGCGDDTLVGADDAGLACDLGFLGDPALPVELRVLCMGPSGTAEVPDGSGVPMILPPQGGKVVLIGVQATNLHACGATLTGVLRDPLSDRIRLEGRTINLEPTGDGWGGSVDGDMSTFANIPVCPNQWAASEIDGAMFELTVTITDRDGRTATETKNVTPFCSEPEFEAECTCQCQVDYMLGQECLAL